MSDEHKPVCPNCNCRNCKPPPPKPWDTRRSFMQGLSAVLGAFALPWGAKAAPKPTEPAKGPTINSLMVNGGTVRISGKVVELRAFPGATIIIESDSLVENLTSIGGTGPIFQSTNPRKGE